nr:putative reverse transcriptase domain-containing protein [Tanacetum cinerariifolium]
MLVVFGASDQKEATMKHLEDVLEIRNLYEVFPEDLPGLPPPRQVEFRIELVPGAEPVAHAPYLLAPSKMKELAEKLQEFSEKDTFARAHRLGELWCCL